MAKSIAGKKRCKRTEKMEGTLRWVTGQREEASNLVLMYGGLNREPEVSEERFEHFEHVVAY